MHCPPRLPSAATGDFGADEDEDGDDGVFGASYTKWGCIGVDSEAERGDEMANPVAVQAAAEKFKLGVRMLWSEVM